MVTGLINNRTYQFKIRAANKYGEGTYSAVSLIRPTGVPEGLSSVRTALVGSNVRVEWQAFDTKGRTISAYEVQFRLSDGETFIEIPLFCNGRDPFVLKNRYCYIPMLVFRLSPFFQLQSELIVARVRAYNIKGWGPYNEPNTLGQLIVTEPRIMY